MGFCSQNNDGYKVWKITCGQIRKRNIFPPWCILTLHIFWWAMIEELDYKNSSQFEWRNFDSFRNWFFKKSVNCIIFLSENPSIFCNNSQAIERCFNKKSIILLLRERRKFQKKHQLAETSNCDSTSTKKENIWLELTIINVY